MSDENPIILERPDAQVAIVRLNRPERMNSLKREVIVELLATFDALNADESCMVIVLTGTGRAFCAGMDVKASSERRTRAEQAGNKEGLRFSMALQEVYGSMAKRVRALRQPVIAAVNGPAVGAGFALSLACDVRIAGRAARFLTGAVRLGITAGESGISYYLPRLIGASRAFEIMLTGRDVSADEAERIGLVSRVVEDDQLLPSALETARMIATNPPYSIKHTKQVMWTNLDAPGLDAALELENHAQTLGAMSRDFAEATRAFAEKRKPTFTGD